MDYYDFSENQGEFEYLTKSSAIYSSNIEGNSIDLNSYMNYEMNKDKLKVGKEIVEIEDLIEAYGFAQNNELNEKNLLACHKIFSDTLLIRSKRGKYRIEQVGVFYFASLIHLRFAQIHPFRDGNGRAARLIEKWFVAEKLGHDFWKMASEEYYKNNQAKYYETINLGVNYYELNYDKCIRFLEMLPNCLE